MAANPSDPAVPGEAGTPSWFARAAAAWPDWALALKNLFLPVYCKACGVRILTEDNVFFCPDCWMRAPWIEPPYCTCCGKPHPGMIALGNAPEHFPCADCRETKHPRVDRVFAPAVYDDVVKTAVKLFKFGGRRQLARPMGEALRDMVRERMDPDLYELIIPVPLHPVRLRQRGFNQSLLLAQEVLPEFPGAALDSSLIRVRPTRAQSRLKPKERAENVRGAFAVTGDTVKKKTILLVDDVVTTRETVTECARVLRRAGAARVDVLAFALAVPRTRW